MTIARTAGVTLLGTPAPELLPAVPAADFVTAIWDYDGKSARTRIAADPVYHILKRRPRGARVFAACVAADCP